MKFKKTCFECGAKVDVLYEGKCEKCFVRDNPPIAQIKPINFKYCNSCKKIYYNNQLLIQEEVEKRIVEIVRKHLIINEHYVLNDVFVENFEIIGGKVSFDVEVDCDFKA